MAVFAHISHFVHKNKLLVEGCLFAEGNFGGDFRLSLQNFDDFSRPNLLKLFTAKMAILGKKVIASKIMMTFSPILMVMSVMGSAKIRPSKATKHYVGSKNGKEMRVCFT